MSRLNAAQHCICKLSCMHALSIWASSFKCVRLFVCVCACMRVLCRCVYVYQCGGENNASFSLTDVDRRAETSSPCHQHRLTCKFLFLLHSQTEEAFWKCSSMSPGPNPNRMVALYNCSTLLISLLY